MADRTGIQISTALSIRVPAPPVFCEAERPGDARIKVRALHGESSTGLAFRIERHVRAIGFVSAENPDGRRGDRCRRPGSVWPDNLRHRGGLVAG